MSAIVFNDASIGCPYEIPLHSTSPDISAFACDMKYWVSVGNGILVCNAFVNAKGQVDVSLVSVVGITHLLVPVS